MEAEVFAVKVIMVLVCGTLIGVLLREWFDLIKDYKKEKENDNR